MRQNGSNHQSTLIAGRDFNELGDGRLVFTREYLLARGTCCGSVCQNCPYENRRIEHRPNASLVFISFVPSWTETLIAADVQVVGRTRFCIHPKDLVKDLVSLGGTKTLSPSVGDEILKIRDRYPDRSIFAVLDREENPKFFYEELIQLGVEPFVTHVEKLEDIPRELGRLEELMKSHHQEVPAKSFAILRSRFETVLGKRHQVQPKQILKRAVLKVSEGVDPSAMVKAEKLCYLIWKKPWMTISHQTLIASVLEFVLSRPEGSAKAFLFSPGDGRYPEIKELPESVLPVYSSEPYPFLKEYDQLPKGIFVDGELYSWFGIRLLRFLEDLVEQSG